MRSPNNVKNEIGSNTRPLPRCEWVEAEIDKMKDMKKSKEKLIEELVDMRERDLPLPMHGPRQQVEAQ